MAFFRKTRKMQFHVFLVSPLSNMKNVVFFVKIVHFSVSFFWGRFSQVVSGLTKIGVKTLLWNLLHFFGVNFSSVLGCFHRFTLRNWILGFWPFPAGFWHGLIDILYGLGHFGPFLAVANSIFHTHFFQFLFFRRFVTRFLTFLVLIR